MITIAFVYGSFKRVPRAELKRGAFQAKSRWVEVTARLTVNMENVLWMEGDA